jgi:hypothetical protein
VQHQPHQREPHFVLHECQRHEPERSEKDGRGKPDYPIRFPVRTAFDLFLRLRP